MGLNFSPKWITRVEFDISNLVLFYSPGSDRRLRLTLLHRHHQRHLQLRPPCSLISFSSCRNPKRQQCRRHCLRLQKRGKHNQYTILRCHLMLLIWEQISLSTMYRLYCLGQVFKCLYTHANENQSVNLNVQSRYSLTGQLINFLDNLFFSLRYETQNGLNNTNIKSSPFEKRRLRLQTTYRHGGCGVHF